MHNFHNCRRFPADLVTITEENVIFWQLLVLGHGVKVGPGPQDLGPWDPRIRDPGPPSKFKSGTPGSPSKFKSGIPGPSTMFKIRTLIITFLHRYI